MLLFPGDWLHGVCPCAPPPASREAPRGGRAPSLRTAAQLPRRITLMIGFWTRDVASMLSRPHLTACGPIPRTSRATTWPALLEWPAPTMALTARDASTADASTADASTADASTAEASFGPPVRHVAVEVSPAWAALEPPDTTRSVDAWASHGVPLSVPPERDNGFFVRTTLEEAFAFENVEHEIRRVEELR